MTDEKRKRKRVVFILETKFTPDQGVPIHPTIRDISMGGMFLITPENIAVGTMGKIEITLRCGAEQKTVQAQCKVVRRVKPFSDRPGQEGVGVEITDIDPDSSIILFNIIKYQNME